MPRAKRDPVWTEERTETLVRMWGQGLGSGAIARALGVVSRNAVMGKVNRLGLMGSGGDALLPRAGSGTVSDTAAPAGPECPPTQGRLSPVVPAQTPREAARAATLGLLQRLSGTGSLPAPMREPGGPEALHISPAATAPEPATEQVAAARRAETLRREAEASAALRAVARAEAQVRERARVAEAAAERAKRRDEREPLGPEEDEGLGWADPADRGQPVTLLRLRACMCRWPFGDPAKPGFHFCGASAPEGKPYCAEHAAVAYEAPQARTARQAAWTPARLAKVRLSALQNMKNRRPGRRSRKFAPMAAE